MKMLVIRADASTEIGTGHLMRCLALGQAWKDAGGEVIFITACQSEGLLRRLQEEQFDLNRLTHSHPDPSDWDYTRGILAASTNAWVVLDGCHFDESYQQQIKNVGHRLLVIDDRAHLKHYYADIVLNQNLGADKLHYSCEPYSRLLLGTRYVLLRREFLAWKDWQREIPEVAHRVLVTLGGSDSENHTLKVIQALQKIDIPNLEATVVIGASNPHVDLLEAEVKQIPIPIRLVRDVQDMPEFMVWADLAISAGGSTVWELAWMGVPRVLLVLAENQRNVADKFNEIGAAVNLGWGHRIDASELIKKLRGLLIDSECLQTTIQRAKTLVDGEGAQRVIMYLTGENLRLRQVCEEDCRLIWEWANDPATRAASFSTEPIPWSKHVRWFRKNLSDPGFYYYILLSEEDAPIGHAHFDISGNEAEINITIAPNSRSRGYGAKVIKMASQRLFQETNITRIYAHTKPNNYASIYAFTKAGYKTVGKKMIKGHEGLEMVLDKNKGAFEYAPN